jgi:cytochrome c553
MKNIRISLTSFLFAACFSSCYYDHFKELHPEAALANTSAGCDTSGTMSYSLQIVPILHSGCTQSCHNGTGAGHDMTSYAAVNGDALSGTLYGSVSWDGSAQAMPQNGAKLSDCDIIKIKKWISAGAPNN